MANRIFVLFVYFIVFASGCKKDSSSTNTGVPNVAVNFNIDLDNPQYVNLTVIGGWMYLGNVGYLNHGVIVYRASEDQFYAMDRTCTYNNNGVVQMTNSTGFFAIDSSCGSVFTIPTGGTVDKGPASLPLKNYSASYDEAQNMVYVSN
jgi:hypothetical protein